jgi:hypothetical protein
MISNFKKPIRPYLKSHPERQTIRKQFQLRLPNKVSNCIHF